MTCSLKVHISTHFSKEFDNDGASIFDGMQLLDKFISRQKQSYELLLIFIIQQGFKAIGTMDKESQPF